MWIRHPHWQLSLIILPSTCRYLLVSDTGLVCNIGHTSETHPKVKSREVSFIYSIRFNNPIVVISLPCPVQHFKTILQLIYVLSSDEISRDGSLKCVAISHSNPGLVPQLILDIIMNPSGTHQHIPQRWWRNCYALINSFCVYAYWYQFHTIHHTKYGMRSSSCIFLQSRNCHFVHILQVYFTPTGDIGTIPHTLRK